jgi:prolyl oligopeptidase
MNLKKNILLFSLLPLTLLFFSGCGQHLDYPESRTVDHIDLFHGTEVQDPYRWLEDSSSSDTKNWVEAQNQLTFDYLSALPDRVATGDRLAELWDYEKFGVPVKYGKKYFYSYNDGLQNQSRICILEDLEAEPTVILDPNALSEDGTIALTSYKVSPDGKFMAYGLSSGGSDWQEWKIRNVETNEDLPDLLKWIKFSSVSWSSDSSGFYYSRYEEPGGGDLMQNINKSPKVCFHKVDTDQEKDSLAFERPEQPDWMVSGNVTEDGTLLILNIVKGTSTKNGLFYKDLTTRNSKVVEFLLQFDARYDFIGKKGSRLWFFTDLDAPRGCLIEIDINDPVRDRWKIIIPESEDTLEGVHLLNNMFVCTYMKDAASLVRIFKKDGTPSGDIELPGLGSAAGFTGKQDDKETFYSFSSFTSPPSVYRYDLKTGTSELFRKPELDFNPDNYETKQVFCTSKDGTRVPIFITAKKGIKMDNQNPALLYGYGGFNISIKPSFSVSRLVWMEQGGVFALATLRGGGEYGAEWHEAGMKLNKQNVFDDFIASGEWLIQNGYTSRKKLAIEGGSNGGLLVGAVVNQRPDLFAAAVPHVGVMDMLRFHEFTIGWAWVSDYGSPENPEEFEALYAYSPYHNLKKGTEYPATLIITGDHDDRVVPLHSFKYAARMQQVQDGNNPILIRIETRAGHGAGKPTAKKIEESADILAFLAKQCGK